MRVEGAVVVVTGGAMGIGRALVERFHAEGAKAIVVADLDEAKANEVAAATGSPNVVARKCDVAVEADLVRVIDETETRLGPIDLFCSNAGIASFDPVAGEIASAPNEVWQRSWNVNVMAHMYAARALTPRMVARGKGYFLHTVSAAGLLNQIAGAVYATTKHAAIGFAENLALTYRDRGLRVSVLCPQGVDTPMLRTLPHGSQNVDGVLSAEAVAESVVQGLANETFLILPHPQVLEYMRKKTADYDRWIGGMAKLKRALDRGSI